MLPLIDTAVNALTSVINTNKTIRAQKELSKYAYEKDLEMWNKANVYNSPVEQKKRLEDAELNPNLVYGSGSVVGNTSTQTPKYQMYDTTYRYQAPRISDALTVLGQWQDYQYKKAQSEGARLDNIEKIFRNKVSDDLWSGRRNKMFIDIDRAGSEATMADLRSRFMPLEQEQMKSRFPLELSKTSAEIANMVENTRSKWLENNLFEKTGMAGSANWIAKMFGVALTKKFPNLFQTYNLK